MDGWMDKRMEGFLGYIIFLGGYYLTYSANGRGGFLALG